jgi:Xaa-Pro aminopeptidase
LTSIAITPAEHRARCDALLAATEGDGVSGIVLFDPYYVLYYAGFAFVPTERPIGFILAADGTRALVVPRLEVEHAETRSTLDRVEHYLEYPGDPRPETVLAKTLSDLGVRGTIGADQDGYPWILGYRGPTLADLSGASVIRVRERIEEQMAIKSEAEVALIRESVRWGNLAHRLLQRYTRVRRDRDGGLPAREQRGDVRDARRNRRDLSSAELRRDGRQRRVSRPDRSQFGHPAFARRQHGLPGR